MRYARNSQARRSSAAKPAKTTCSLEREEAGRTEIESSGQNPNRFMWGQLPSAVHLSAARSPVATASVKSSKLNRDRLPLRLGSLKKLAPLKPKLSRKNIAGEHLDLGI